jgi:hypothetical protein
VGGDAKAVHEVVRTGAVKYPVVLDSDGTALALVAADKPRLMPRTFLLDKTGKILWFDIEYSRTTRRDLHQALRFLLSDRGQP